MPLKYSVIVPDVQEPSEAGQSIAEETRLITSIGEWVLRTAGQPELFMSHGVRDDVLPIHRCSRRIAPQLQRAGYDVDYREYDGPHIVPADMVSAALDGFLRD